ncbi:Phosphatidylinositol/phosphatidylcholine transfer protein [Seminavis robusta]|uniref:Phosphatidylinositol/phosphatidylcholine transfer protein n=1 Tax=Seminavis robusta TaxID=568900 RepID=A0A9N8EGU6_9STRA|nr:Phosphatidylinositol/phosphatidylcholine transfer protein [Seminavis robusta]|eukprot:Sro926_g220970.1 Phosphatidylinositol/phosphatidylcholine transfer protein (750) ;mRNA; f:4983-7338
MVTASKPYEERWSLEQVDECVQLWKLSFEQTDKLLEFKTRVADIDHWKNDPFEVVRFLVEFKFDLKTTERKFRASIQWRIDNGADTILEDYTPPALYNYFPLGVLEGADRDNDPIYIERSGAADTLALLHRFGKDEMIKQAIWAKELMTRGPWQQEQWRHGRVKYFTTILDLKGLNRHHMNPSLVPVGQAVTRLVQDNYPGFGKKILVVRAPYIFRFVWNIFKHFVDPNVKELIEIATEKETEEILEQYMDLSVLPKEIAPSKGQGTSVQGYETIWEGGPLPPTSKDDWNRRAPVFPQQQQNPAQEQPITTVQQSTSNAEVEVSLAKIPSIKANMSGSTCGASVSITSSTDEWERLPQPALSKKNIQQAWTVTPSPVYNLDEVWRQDRLDDMSQLWGLTQRQQQDMQELRNRIQDIHHWKNDPYEVVRYYVEFKGDLDRSEHAFRKMIVWRVENRMDNFLQQYGEPDPLFLHMPMCILRGTDKDGDPIFLDRIGACDYTSLLKHFGQDGVTDYVTFVRELNSCRPFWKPYEFHVLKQQRVRSYTVIIDLEGLTPAHARPALLTLLNRTSRIAHYYSGWAKRILIIRAPPIFRLVWGLVKGYFAVHVRDMIEFAGHHSYQVLLDKYIEREVLPFVICPEGKGGPMPGYYEDVKLEGGPIPREAFDRVPTTVSFRQSASPTTFDKSLAKGAFVCQSAPMAPTSTWDDDDSEDPHSPVAARRLLIGTWEADEGARNTYERSDSITTYTLTKG